MQRTIKILFLASEAETFIKVGGLGDVAYALPKAVRELSAGCDQVVYDVRLVIPFHSSIREKFKSLELVAQFDIQKKNGTIQAQIFEASSNGLPVYLVKGDPIPEGVPVYSENALLDTEKYTFFSLAAAMLPLYINWMPDIYHANDWHTAITVNILSQWRKSYRLYKSIKTILTVHNLPFLGMGIPEIYADYFINPIIDNNLPQWAQNLPLPLGLATADLITTVSNTYAKEILTPEYGCGLEEYLLSVQDRLVGIVNGIDYQIWNPQDDPYLQTHYSQLQLEQKSGNKDYLLHKFFPQSANVSVPLLTIIGRLDHQKGVDFLIKALADNLDREWKMVILGLGNPLLENEIKKLSSQYPDKIAAVLKFDIALSHQLYAGADLLLMPSRYEPCGLAQMIAMRYGTIPVARATGGLKDTITNCGSSEQCTGFLFNLPSADALSATLNTGLELYKDAHIWKKIQLNAMNKNFSWSESARKYAGLYKDLIGGFP